MAPAVMGSSLLIKFCEKSNFDFKICHRYGRPAWQLARMFHISGRTTRAVTNPLLTRDTRDIWLIHCRPAGDTFAVMT